MHTGSWLTSTQWDASRHARINEHTNTHTHTYVMHVGASQSRGWASAQQEASDRQHQKLKNDMIKAAAVYQAHKVREETTRIHTLSLCICMYVSLCICMYFCMHVCIHVSAKSLQLTHGTIRVCSIHMKATNIPICMAAWHEIHTHTHTHTCTGSHALTRLHYKCPVVILFMFLCRHTGRLRVNTKASTGNRSLSDCRMNNS
jgi:hypothetical protein